MGIRRDPSTIAPPWLGGAVLLGDCDLALWHVPAEERLRRACRQIGLPDHRIHVMRSADAARPTDCKAADRVLVARVDCVFEPRALAALVARNVDRVLADRDGQPVAALVRADRIPQAVEWLAGRASGEALPDDTCEWLTPAELGAHDRRLRRAAPPLVSVVTPDNFEALEAELYGNAYKGVTDLVTKFLWPRPSAWLVRRCARMRITPNQVTLTSFILVLVAGWCFAQGSFVAGLVAAWLMTLLDTVDGKLARVTVQSSRFGDLFDHGIDLIHPPFWYLAWGIGLDPAHRPFDWSIGELAAWIFIPYIIGRLTEGAFNWICGGSMFTWRPFDSWFRLITTRRNPALVLLTLSVLAHQPALGLLAVIAWAVVSAMIQGLRLAQAIFLRLTGRPVVSWLADPAAAQRYPSSYRVFATTRGAFRR
ncbi:MAG: CDP-alcohol phosphatidyltransferase family protein [Wenzhouxiangellaceae bacterium]